MGGVCQSTVNIRQHCMVRAPCPQILIASPLGQQLAAPAHPKHQASLPNFITPPHMHQTLSHNDPNTQKGTLRMTPFFHPHMPPRLRTLPRADRRGGGAARVRAAGTRAEPRCFRTRQEHLTNSVDTKRHIANIVTTNKCLTSSNKKLLVKLQIIASCYY